MKLAQLCGLVFLLYLFGCREAILHDLDEVRANQVFVVLESSGFKVKKVQEGKRWNIEVPTADVANALRSLEQSRVLLRDISRFKTEAKGFLATREERQQNLERQFAWTLEQTLEAVPGVIESRVHIYSADSGNEQIIGSASGKNSASVLVIESTADSVTEEEIRKLVAGASGIEPGNLSIVVVAKSTTRISHNEAKEITKDSVLSQPFVLRMAKYQPVIIGATLGLIICLLLLALVSRKKRKSVFCGKNDSGDEAAHEPEALGEVNLPLSRADEGQPSYAGLQ